MGIILFITGWLAVGVIIAATVLGLLGVPAMERRRYNDRDTVTEGFLIGSIFGSIFWPVMLAVATAYFPARALYRWAIKHSNAA